MNLPAPNPALWPALPKADRPHLHLFRGLWRCEGHSHKGWGRTPRLAFRKWLRIAKTIEGASK